MTHPAIHYFDHRGDSVLSNDHLTDMVAELQAENDALNRRVTSLTRRLRQLAGDETVSEQLDS